MTDEPEVGAWLEPAIATWWQLDEVVKAASAALTVVGVVLGLLYLGAYLERRHLKAQLQVLEGGAAPAEEVAGGSRG